MISSCGGHLMELLRLLPAVRGYNFYIVTERNVALESTVKEYRHYYLIQQERSGLNFCFKFLWNIILSLFFLLKERPSVIITTGAGASYPTCIIGKWFGAKVIYIESFAKLNSPSVTGKLVYRFADKFYVQWPEMKSIYPKAEYHGKVY